MNFIGEVPLQPPARKTAFWVSSSTTLAPQLHRALHRAAVPLSISTSHGICWFVIPGCVESFDRISARGSPHFTHSTLPPACHTHAHTHTKSSL